MPPIYPGLTIEYKLNSQFLRETQLLSSTDSISFLVPISKNKIPFTTGL